MKYLACSLSGILLIAGWASAGVEADPNKEYAITQDVGPWMVCTASFSGDQAAKMAHDMVIELRSKYNLPAYVFNRGAELRREQQEEVQRKRQQQKEYLERMGLHPDMPLRLPTVRIDEQCAVLVGGYPDIDSAHKKLQEIKKLQPPTSVPPDILTIDVVRPTGSDKKNESHRAPINPFVNSFVARNPALPVQREPEDKPDPFWKELNAGESYSVLKCPKAWTLAIKDYQSTVVVQPASAPTNFLEKLLGNNAGAQLNAQAMNAHQLAEVLRKVGFEAYVLHTRGCSVVTVGAFDNPDDPRIAQAARALQAMQLQNIELFPKPMPMKVPRFDSAADAH
jgi:hypothetical protein